MLKPRSRDHYRHTHSVRGEVGLHVLLNCSTLVKGGALQAAVAFIGTAVNTVDQVKWHFVTSGNVLKELHGAGVTLRSEQLSVIDESPARSHRSRKRIQSLVKEVNPDLVFTFFGPAYADFEVPHLCGVADGWVTHGGRWAWRTVRSPIESIRLLGTILYKAVMFKRADAWVTESMTAKKGLVKRLRIPEERIAVVPNNCADHYLRREAIAERPSIHERLNILCLSAYYKHKNLEIIPHVAKELQDLLPGREVRFILTLPVDSHGLRNILSRAAVLGVEDRIVNVGPVPVAQGPELYRSCQMLFLPSVLETFSANYPEAMAMGLPIVTTNLSFARDVCGEAGIYFEPMNARDAAHTIGRLCGDERLWKSMVVEGKRILRALPDQQLKYEMYRNCLYELYQRHGDQGRTILRNDRANAMNY